MLVSINSIKWDEYLVLCGSTRYVWIEADQNNSPIWDEYLVICGLGSRCQASVLGSNSTICGGILWSTGKLEKRECCVTCVSKFQETEMKRIKQF